MIKSLEKNIHPTPNHNLVDFKPLKKNATPPSLKEGLNATPEITPQAQNLKKISEKSLEKATEKIPEESSKKTLEKATEVAQKISKAPLLPIAKSSSNSKKTAEKVINENSDKKIPPLIHLKKEPAVIFIEGFSAFGISNGDGIKDMSENFPGSKRFDWTDHEKIIDEIKKHAPDQAVILVGHSFGGDTAIEVANELNSAKNGFRPIDLLVSIDAVGMNKTIIPINVKSNLNFFGEGIIPFLHGDPTVARNTKYTDVINELRSDMHSRMDDNPEIQFEIFKKINDVLGKTSPDEEIFFEMNESQMANLLEAIKNNI